MSDVCVVRPGAWMQKLKQREDGAGWARLVLWDFIGVCALGALVAALLSLSGC